MDGTGQRTCDADKDRIQHLEQVLHTVTSEITSLLALPPSREFSIGPHVRQRLKGLQNRVNAVMPPQPQSEFCEHCPTDGSPCGVCGGANGVKPDYTDEPAEGERDY